MRQQSQQNNTIYGYESPKMIKRKLDAKFKQRQKRLKEMAEEEAKKVEKEEIEVMEKLVSETPREIEFPFFTVKHDGVYMNGEVVTNPTKVYNAVMFWAEENCAKTED